MHVAGQNRGIVANAPTIIQEFGFGAYVRCMAASLLSRRPRTFLEMAMRLPTKGREARVDLSRN